MGHLSKKTVADVTTMLTSISKMIVLAVCLVSATESAKNGGLSQCLHCDRYGTRSGGREGTYYGTETFCCQGCFGNPETPNHTSKCDATNSALCSSTRSPEGRKRGKSSTKKCVPCKPRPAKKYISKCDQCDLPLVGKTRSYRGDDFCCYGCWGDPSGEIKHTKECSSFKAAQAAQLPL